MRMMMIRSELVLSHTGWRWSRWGCRRARRGCWRWWRSCWWRSGLSSSSTAPTSHSETLRTGARNDQSEMWDLYRLHKWLSKGFSFPPPSRADHGGGVRHEADRGGGQGGGGWCGGDIKQFGLPWKKWNNLLWWDLCCTCQVLDHPLQLLRWKFLTKLLQWKLYKKYNKYFHLEILVSSFLRQNSNDWDPFVSARIETKMFSLW